MFVVLVGLLLILSRLGFGGIRVADGTYLGYSKQSQEWLFFEYQNVYVRHDGPYIFKNGENLEALYIQGDGVTSKLSKVSVVDEFPVQAE